MRKILVMLFLCSPLFAKYVEIPYTKSKPTKATLLGTVYFSYGSSRITKENRKQLRKIAENILDMMSISPLDENQTSMFHPEQLKIIGFADSAGNSEFNLQLGLKRAEAVARALEDYGIPIENAKIASYGETKSAGKALKYRRVEVWYMPKAKFPTVYFTIIFILFILLFGGIILYFLQRPRQPVYY
ncbi:MAG: OmpA family protein [Candidatus Hydrogenedentota bacterium]|nr:MAG: OmpA family protein [Candidatus Hydrogenedentota bacterium]